MMQPLQLNMPFANNESDRVPPHVHPNEVIDPGHTHEIYGSSTFDYSYAFEHERRRLTGGKYTLPSVTGITLRIDPPVNGSYNPQLYVLLCQAVAI